MTDRMVRLVALLLCTAPATVAESPAATAALLRGSSTAQDAGVAEKAGVSDRRRLTGSMTDDEEVLPARAYSHVGCFADSKPDRVLGHLMMSAEMTSEVCAEHCYSRRATYMATQHGNECWCSRDPELDFDRHTEIVVGEYGLCNMYCYGDEEETCGGYEAFDLYKITEPMVSDSPEYVGCFADDRDDRLLTNEIKFQDDMTQAVCRAHCEAFDSLFYATQFGNECWCGNSDDVGDYMRHGNGTCLAGCFGDPAIACGGYDAFSLFEYLDEVWETAAPCTSTSSTFDETSSPTSSPTQDGTPTSTCSNGIPGLESPNGACCVAACTQCGGIGCSTSGAAMGLGSAECCEGTILENDKPCGEAPCVIGGGVVPTPAPVEPPTPAPVMSEPTTPAPVEPETRAPVTPETPAPVTTTRAPVTPETSAPVTPETPAPVTPETPAPVTPTPGPVTPETPSPVAPTPGPVTPETPSPVTPTPEPVASPPSGGGAPAEYEELLDLHNAIRCMHGTDPMVWSDEVASFAQEYAAEMTSSGRCSQMEHSNGSGYGENLYMCWGSNTCYTAEGAMIGWYDEEVEDGGPLTYEGHATQVLWTDSTELGCAVATCDKSGTPYTFLTCNYNPPGNWRGETETYVMPPSKTKDECGYEGTRAPLVD